jgi:hypothetical protein
MRVTFATLLNQSAAGNGTPFACDWKNDGVQQRRVFIPVMNAADTITIQGSMDGTNWTNLIAPFTGATSGFLLVEGPVAQIRAVKTGAAGTALVQGAL